MSNSHELPKPDLSGRILDRYRLIRRIGVGGMGAVYEAEHTHLRKHVAVKLLRAELADDEVFRQRFLREARAASAVDHPHVVAISDSGETDDGHVFLAMELLTGRDLRQLLKEEGALGWPRARAILLQVTSALRAAHARDIVHRDIKPSNVFLVDRPKEASDQAPEDFVKLVDFGIAKLTGSSDASSAELTSPQQIVGTVAYISPEMAMGVKDDRRSDIYAVGVMMYQMLTGELPFAGGNALGILAQHIHAPIPSPRDRQPSLPEAVEAIVLQAMAKKPEDRIPTMAAFNHALQCAAPDVDQIEPTELLESIGLGEGERAAASSTELVDRPPDDTEDTPHRSDERDSGAGRFVWPLLAVAVAAVVVLWIAAAPNEPALTRDAPSAAAEPPKGAPVADPTVDPRSQPVIAGTTTGGDRASSTTSDTSGHGGSIDTTTGPEPSGTSGGNTGPEPAEPTRPKAPRKPRTDAQVVATLEARVERKCGRALAGSVRVEGLITAAGRVQSLLVTPQGGLGACERLVENARFDPAGGARPMPRFTVAPQPPDN